MIKTTTEFNEKYKDYLEEGYYGISLIDIDVLNYLDNEFMNEIEKNPDFNYSQIKSKFNKAYIYSNSKSNSLWEQEINTLLL